MIFENQDCILLTETYNNTKEKLKYICRCGEIYYKSLDKFKKSYKCKKCRYKQMAKNQSFSYEEVKKEFEKRNCVLLEKEYKGTRTPMSYICSCGNTSKIRLDDLKRGYRCSVCGGNKRLTYEEVKSYIEYEGYVLLSEKYINANEKLKTKCPKGHVYHVSFGSFKQGYRCMKCAVEKRSGLYSNLYNPNLTIEERIKLRSYEEYRKWRTSVYERDNYTCVCCEKIGGKLNAHHIYNYNEHEELRTDIDNGVTMCSECHNKFHRIYGYKNNNLFQLHDFIKKENKFNNLKEVF